MVQFEYFHIGSSAPSSEEMIYFSHFTIGTRSSSQIKTRFHGEHSSDAANVEITLRAGDLLIKTLNKNPIFLNDKKIVGTIKAIVGDKIKINSTQFKILAIAPPDTQELDFETKYKDFLLNNPEYHSVIKAMEVELIHASDEIIIPKELNQQDDT